MGGAQQLTSPFTDDDAGRHGVASYDARHDGTIGDAQALDAVHSKLGVYDRHRVAAHLCGARLMVVRQGALADEIFQRRSLQCSWHHLAFGVWPEWSGIPDFAT